MDPARAWIIRGVLQIVSFSFSFFCHSLMSPLIAGRAIGHHLLKDFSWSIIENFLPFLPILLLSLFFAFILADLVFSPPPLLQLLKLFPFHHSEIRLKAAYIPVLQAADLTFFLLFFSQLSVSNIAKHSEVLGVAPVLSDTLSCFSWSSEHFFVFCFFFLFIRKPYFAFCYFLTNREKTTTSQYLTL